ncbi:MAG TPA: hypothetical protein VFX60_19170 [Micromonospora sp.]|nr:hypothetical protein [Micromonospora sp.]
MTDPCGIDTIPLFDIPEPRTPATTATRAPVPPVWTTYSGKPVACHICQEVCHRTRHDRPATGPAPAHARRVRRDPNTGERKLYCKPHAEPIEAADKTDKKG